MPNDSAPSWLFLFLWFYNHAPVAFETDDMPAFALWASRLNPGEKRRALSRDMSVACLAAVGLAKGAMGDHRQLYLLSVIFRGVLPGNALLKSNSEEATEKCTKHCLPNAILLSCNKFGESAHKKAYACRGSKGYDSNCN